MKQYIDKSAVVAEIERLREEEYPCDTFEESTGYYNALDEVSSFINTLEVKDVDLEKEFDNYTKNILACDVLFEPFTHLYNCAKHFFELGLKVVQKGE